MRAPTREGAGICPLSRLACGQPPSPQGEGLGKTKMDRFWICPLKHRGETQFRRKFLCLLSFSKKVGYTVPWRKRSIISWVREMARRARVGRVGDYEHEVLIRSRPRRVLGYLSRTPGEAQRSGFAGKRRSKEAVAVFAARRKRRQADFATTSRRGQSHSPPTGGEISRVQRAQSEPCPLIRHGFAVPPFPIPSVASRHHPYPFWPSAISP